MGPKFTLKHFFNFLILLTFCSAHKHTWFITVGSSYRSAVQASMCSTHRGLRRPKRPLSLGSNGAPFMNFVKLNYWVSGGLEQWSSTVSNCELLWSRTVWYCVALCCTECCTMSGMKTLYEDTPRKTSERTERRRCCLCWTVLYCNAWWPILLRFCNSRTWCVSFKNFDIRTAGAQPFWANCSGRNVARNRDPEPVIQLRIDFSTWESQMAPKFTLRH